MGWIWPLTNSSWPADTWTSPSVEEKSDRRISTRRVVKSTCRTEEVEPGKFVRKCDKTEQILRECVGRPAELVESNTDHTEEDVTDEVTSHRLSFGSSHVDDPFSFPGLRNDIDVIERSVHGKFRHLADELMDKVFQSFGMSENDMDSIEIPFDGKDGPQLGNGSAFDEYAGKARDI